MSSTRGAAFDRLFPLGYAALLAAVALILHLAVFTIGDLGTESDFYAEMGPAAQALAHGRLQVTDFPFKGPVTAGALALLHLVAGPLGADWYDTGVLLNALCAAAFLVLLYGLLRRSWPRATAATATVSVSLAFEFFLHAHKATSDLLFLLLFYASAALLLDAGGRRRLLAAGAVGGLAYLTRYNGMVLLPAALAAVLVLGAGRPWRARLVDWGIYAAGFLLVALPWFALGIAQTGRPLATHNLGNIFVQEFYPGARAAELPHGELTSLPALILHDPVRFARLWLGNLVDHFGYDLRRTLSWGVAVLFVLGVARALLVRLDRRQAALLCFPLLYFLAMGLVYIQPRFSLPLLPAYAVLAAGVVFGSRAERPERPGPPRDRQRWLTILPPGAGRRRLGPRPLLAAAVLLAALVLQVQETRNGVTWYADRRPTFVLDLAPTLKRLAPRGERTVLMARKPHAAFYAGLRYQPYPAALTTPAALIAFARAHGVDLVLFSGIEQGEYPQAPWLAALQTQPGVRVIWQDEYAVVYAVSPAPPGAGP